MTYPSPNLDVLRSLAISFVVASHLLLDNSLVGAGGYHTQTLGTLGVLIFFVHTCLVLMLSLERQAATHHQPPSATAFLVARACRIYPLSVVVVILVASVERMHDAWPDFLTILSNLFLIQNLTGSASVTPVLWSLPFEFQMYLFLPALYLLVTRSGRLSAYLITALWGVCVVAVFAFYKIGWDAYLIKFFPCFLPGVLAFCLRHGPRKLPAAALFLYVGAVAIVYPIMVGHGTSATVLSWLICLALGLLIPRCTEINARWLRESCSVIARYSYGIYLVHVPVLNFSFHYLKGIPAFASWAIFMFGVAGLSYLAYHLIEKPGIDLGRALMDRLSAGRARAATARQWSNF